MAQMSDASTTDQKHDAPNLRLPPAQFFHEPSAGPAAMYPTTGPPRRQIAMPQAAPQQDDIAEVPPRPVPSRSANSNSSIQEKKMHQTSTRIMRTNPDGRPFANDFHNLFSTLIVSLNLRTHRARFKRYPYSFTTEEAVNNLANLKFAQSNRMPDPNDATRVVTTTTTTTFSMARDMAKALCQRFMDARLFCSATDRDLDSFRDKAIWVLTPKGICKLGRFTMRNGIATDDISKLISSSSNTMQLVVLERDSTTDETLQDKSVVEIVFRRFVGRTPNMKASSKDGDRESMTEYIDGMTGVILTDSRRVGDSVVRHSFTGQSAIAWLLDCSTVLDPDEAHDLAYAFVQNGLILYMGDSRSRPADPALSFQTSKTSIYTLTPKGRRIAGWDTSSSADGSGKISSAVTSSSIDRTMRRMGSQSTSSSSHNHKPPAVNSTENDALRRVAESTNGVSTKETNTNRLDLILADPALRSQFREFLRENYCEENLSFYIDVVEFERQINNVHALEGVSEGLARAYSIYNAYLAAGSPCELNLDHQLRQEMAAQMTKAVDGDGNSMYNSLSKVAELYDRAQKQVFQLMAGDSVPKFLKTSLYLELLDDYGSDENAN